MIDPALPRDFQGEEPRKAAGDEPRRADMLAEDLAQEWSSDESFGETAGP